MSELALYTTIYRGMEKFLLDWYRSVQNQTDQDFELVIGLDDMDLSVVIDALGVLPNAKWILSEAGDSPVQVRQRAIKSIVNNYHAVIFVDSDDILLPKRVEATRESLQKYDVVASSMYLVDSFGNLLDFTFNLPLECNPTDWLIRANVFGLSNTAYQCQILRQCLPIPSECRLLDWYLATCAWLLGGHLGFDSNITMAYRQHENNIARLLPPFTPPQVLTSADLVDNHYQIILDQLLSRTDPRRCDFVKTHNDVSQFLDIIRSRSDVLHQYVIALNRLPPQPMWWACVAHPELEDIWKG